MVINNTKRWGIYAIFVTPALVLYCLFAVIPLLMGIWLSMTNWDGVSPWVPVQIPIERFEGEILPSLKTKTQDFLLEHYIKDLGQGTYRKVETSETSLNGFRKYRAMAAFSRAGYVNDSFRAVGLANYISVFSSESNPDFWPQTLRISLFKPGEPLSKIASIPAKEFEEDFQVRISGIRDAEYIDSLYTLKGGFYVLSEWAFPHKGQKFAIARELIELPDVGDDWEPFLDGVEGAGLNNRNLDIRALAKVTVSSVTDGSISSASYKALEQGAEELYRAANLKRIVSENWFVESRRMGVLLFTVFFSVSNVLAVNIAALLVALALDQHLKSKNLLRSLFFIPNVLSMIVVAFIWQLVFSHVLPIITGIDRWLSNPDLAPALTVIVASWQGMGYFMIVYLAGLQNLPQEILESASIDGAGGFKKFTGIILPMLVPAFTIALFLSISGSLKTFDIIFALYPSTTNTMGVENITINIYRDAFVDRQAGLANSKGILLLLVIGVITGLQLWATKKREVEL